MVINGYLMYHYCKVLAILPCISIVRTVQLFFAIRLVSLLLKGLYKISALFYTVKIYILIYFVKCTILYFQQKKKLHISEIIRFSYL